MEATPKATGSGPVSGLPAWTPAAPPVSFHRAPGAWAGLDAAEFRLRKDGSP